MNNPWEERQILRDIIDGLNSAIAMNYQRLGFEEIDPIKLNKLIYLAVHEFELDISYRWFKYGSDFTKHGNVDVASVHAVPINDLPSPDSPRIADSREEDDLPPTPRDYKHFFEREIENIDRIFTEETREYLRSFYQNYAPEPYEDLYAECAVLQKSIDEIGSADNPGSIIYRQADELLDEISSVRHEVNRIPDLNQQSKPFGRFLKLLKDVVVTVESREGEITNSQKQAIESLVYFFYEVAWLLIALKIASKKSHGPQEESWKTGAKERLKEQEETYSDELYAIYRQCIESDLIDDELLKFRQLSADERESRPMPDVEKRGLEEWKGVSAEANQYL